MRSFAVAAGLTGDGQNVTFAGDQCTLELPGRLRCDTVHGIVVVTGIVMEDREALHPGGAGQAHALLPG